MFITIVADSDFPNRHFEQVSINATKASIKEDPKQKIRVSVKKIFNDDVSQRQCDEMIMLPFVFFFLISIYIVFTFVLIVSNNVGQSGHISCNDFLRFISKISCVYSDSIKIIIQYLYYLLLKFVNIMYVMETT
jgi:hypothetical protein